MRAAISILVSSLVVGSFTLNCQVTKNRSSHLLLASSTSDLQQLLSVRPKPRPNQPEKPAPHRGSGRRELMKNYGNMHTPI
ncbi:MAG: hypothetical protein KME32_08300 [Mojavia pulchra JT2-VF2]|jgi:hypothetical protein|uniref:Uncharacterized protein n=1 Tax=Mojavia pulchra JT2-VF2 TaxID=287848 RepID=A0A951PY34_9NOST|nr:hypothetical protein [Mojavia pulchra JT2-VF2]